MGLIRRAIESRSNPLANGALPLTGKDILRAFGIRDSASGIAVSPDIALQHPGVYACVRIIAEDIAKLPRHVYIAASDGGRKQDRTNPIEGLINGPRMNPEMSSYKGMETLVAHCVLRGNSYGAIERAVSGDPLAIWPVRPDRMTLWREPDGSLVYLYTPMGYGEPHKLLPRDVIHFKGLSYDGIIGYSPIDLERDSVGTMLAAERYGAKFFANDARPGGVLLHPGQLSDKAYARLQQSWAESHQGFDNAMKMAILEEGIEWKSVGLAPDAAQFLQTRKYGLADCSRIFRVPGHKLFETENVNKALGEVASREYVSDTLQPWLTNIEQELMRSLLLPNDSRRYIKFVTNGLLRGDTAARTAYYQAGRQGGWLNTNDIRELEDLNPVKEPAADEYFVPLNMVPLSQVGKEPAAPAPAPADGGGSPPNPDAGAPADPNKGEPKRALELRGASSATARRRLRKPYSRVLADAASRVIKRERADVLRAAEKMLSQRDYPDFTAWLEQFYRGHVDYIGTHMGAPVAAYAEAIHVEAADEIGVNAHGDEIAAFGAAYVASYAIRHAAMSREELSATTTAAAAEAITNSESVADAVIAALTAKFDAWATDRAPEIGATESVRLDNAVARTTYENHGYKARWTAHGKTCSYCNHLDGKVVGRGESFLNAGEDFKPEGASAPLRPATKIGHAPVHKGCDCSIVAAAD